jgi:hypothetical protein
VRRLHLIFVIVVVTAFVSAFLAERSRPFEPAAEPALLPAGIGLPPVKVDRGTHTLRGTVVDHAGAPAAEVTVQARPLAADGERGAREPFHFAHTAADGAFELAHLVPGRYAILLVSPGVENTALEVDVPGARASDPASEPASEPAPTWRLNPPYADVPAAPDPVYVALTGAVRRPPTLPEAGASLDGYEIALLPRDDDARWRGAVERRVPIDAAGHFRVDDLAVADHLIRVLPPWARGGTWPYLVERDLSAAELAAGAGEQPSGEPTLALELDVAELEGRLLDARGRAIEGALLRLQPFGASPERAWPAASTDPEGRFVLRDLPDESGELVVFHDRTSPVQQTVTPGGEPIVVRVELTRRKVPPHMNKFGKPYGRSADAGNY